jgi:hypothetical protein
LGKCRSICASADPCIRNWSDIRACIRNLLDVHATYLESYYYVTNILISCGRSIAVKVGPMPIHLCNCRSMHRELVGHPRFYQKFVGRPRYVFGIYVTNILISCGRCIAVKVGQMPIHFVQVPIHASRIGRTHTLVSEICWTSATYWQSYYYVTNILISCGRYIAVTVGQMPIHVSGIGRTSMLVSEICWTSKLRIGHHTTMLPIY